MYKLLRTTVRGILVFSEFEKIPFLFIFFASKFEVLLEDKTLT